MKYAREYEKLAKRMSESVELEEAWKDVGEVYGKKATSELKELTPADPLLLHDPSLRPSKPRKRQLETISNQLKRDRNETGRQM